MTGGGETDVREEMWTGKEMRTTDSSSVSWAVELLSLFLALCRNRYYLHLVFT